MHAAERHTFLQLNGHAAYAAAIEAELRSSTVRTINGHPIRKVQSRFGRLFAVGDTRRAFSTLQEAVTFARAA